MPTLNFQPIKLLDSDFLYKFTYWMANSADPDQLASWKPTDLDLHCLQIQCISGFSRTRVNEHLLLSLSCLPYFKLSTDWAASADDNWMIFLAHLSRKWANTIPMVRCLSSVHTFKHLLHRNPWTSWSRILCGTSMPCGNKSLHTWSWSHDHDGCPALIW